jgi:transcriptional regulator with XRE-family HTH domain
MGFKENLKSELTYSGMLVKELAVLSGVNKHSIDNYLNARGQIPSVEAAVKIARALGVSVEYLITGKETGQKDAEGHLSKEARAIVQITDQLDERGRKFVLEFVKWIKIRQEAEQKRPE